jgi:Zn-dependent metalloprotease
LTELKKLTKIKKIMKKIIILFALLMVYGGGVLFAQGKYQPKYLREKDGTFQQIAKEMTPSGWIIFKGESKVNAATFFATYATNLGIGQHYEYQLTKDETDNLKIRHQRYQLYYKKTPVEGSEFSLHSRDGILLTAHGRIVEDMDFDLSKPMPEQKALDYALTRANASNFGYFF